MFGSLAKALAVVVELPVALTADLVTLGGAANDRPTTYTGDAASKFVKNVTGLTK